MPILLPIYKVCAKIQKVPFPIIIPVIYSISSYNNESQNQTVVTIIGTDFRYFSKVQLDNIPLDITFISSNVITFNVPRDTPFGQYNIYVFNDNLSSNTITFLHKDLK